MRRRGSILATNVLAGVVLACLLVATGSARAATTFPYSGTTFGPAGPGTFGNVQGLAVDQATGDVFVYDKASESIYKFNSAGEPVNFSELAGNVIEGVGHHGADENELAVDGSAAGPAKGDIYIANGKGVRIYSPGGTQVGELNEAVTAERGAPWSEPCGVATDAAGNVYVGLALGNVNRYTPTSGAVTNVDYSASLNGVDHADGGEICNIAADGEGNVYTNRWEQGPVREYAAGQFGRPKAEGAKVDAHGSTLAVDPATNDLYVDEQDQVAEYSPAHQLIGVSAAVGPGAIAASFGVAFGTTAGKLYASAEEGHGVSIFAPATAIADVTTGVASAARKTTATLNGTVNPLELGVASYYFQYGTSTGYGSQTTEESAGNGGSPVPVSAPLSGLEPETTYHYRLVAVDANGTTFGEDRTFQTAGAVFVSPCVVSDIQARSATFTAITDPEGVSAEYRFLYGQSPGEASTEPQELAGEEELPFTANVEGLAPNRTYHCQLYGEKFEIGADIGPDSTFTTPIAAPEVDSPPPFTTGVALHEATLNGAVSPGNGQSTYHFIYGPTAGYGSSTPVTSLPDNDTPDEATQTITGLAPGTVYHYALVASNSSGTTTGPDHTFSSLTGTPPAVATGAASSIMFEAATISGSVEPAGQPTGYTFEVGTSTAYGTSLFGSTATAETLTANLAGLAPGTLYHYRLRAADAAGSSFGADETFTTLSAPGPLAQPPAALLLASNLLEPPRTPTVTGPGKPAVVNSARLKQALRACRRKHGKHRAACERQARKRYGHRSSK